MNTSWLLGSFAGPPLVHAVSVCEIPSAPATLLAIATKLTSAPCDVTPKSCVAPFVTANWKPAASTTLAIVWVAAPSAPNDTRFASVSECVVVKAGLPSSLPVPNWSPPGAGPAASAPSSTVALAVLAVCTGASSVTVMVKSCANVIVRPVASTAWMRPERSTFAWPVPLSSGASSVNDHEPSELMVSENTSCGLAWPASVLATSVLPLIVAVSIAAPCEVSPRLASQALAAAGETNWNGAAPAPPLPKLTSALSEPGVPVAVKAEPWLLPPAGLKASVTSPPSNTVALIAAPVSPSGAAGGVVTVLPAPFAAPFGCSEPSNGSPLPLPVKVSTENDTKFAPDDTEFGPPEAGSTDWSVVMGKSVANCDAETSRPGASSTVTSGSGWPLSE